MKSKEQLKQVFENGDKPTQEDFWELIESYFHRDIPVTLEELSQLKSNLATIDKTNNGVETLGNVDTKEQVNAKINFAINALKANAPETYDTLKEIADYIANDTNAEVALLQLINTKLDSPSLKNNFYGVWDETNKKFVNALLSEDANSFLGQKKLIIGGGTDNRSRALIRLPAGLDLPYFNFGGTYMWEQNVAIPTNLFAGDMYGANGKLWLVGYNQQTIAGGSSLRKLVGLEYDDTGSFNTPWNFNTYGEDYQSKGFAQLLHTGSYYENTIVSAASSSVGVSNRFKSGVLFNFTVNGIKQQMYLDENGLATRRLNWTDKTSNNWNYSLFDYYNRTTTVGSETNYPSAKFAVDSTNKGSLPAPRMTEIQKNAISSPTDGLMIYQTDGAKGYYVRNNNVWEKLGDLIITAPSTINVNHLYPSSIPTSNYPSSLQSLISSIPNLNFTKSNQTDWYIKTKNDVDYTNNKTVGNGFQIFANSNSLNGTIQNEVLASAIFNKVLPNNKSWIIKTSISGTCLGSNNPGEFVRIGITQQSNNDLVSSFIYNAYLNYNYGYSVVLSGASPVSTLAAQDALLYIIYSEGVLHFIIHAKNSFIFGTYNANPDLGHFKFATSLLYKTTGQNSISSSLLEYWIEPDTILPE